MPLDPSHGYPMPPLQYVETMGGAADQADDIIEGVDATMRAAYDTHITRVGNNIYPIIYVDFTLVGGRYTLVEDESKIHVRAPDLKNYAQLKAIAHIPLAIFVQIAEYVTYPGNGQWIPSVEAYQEQLRTVYNQVAHTEMDEQDKTACGTIVLRSIEFLRDILGRKTFTLEEFRAYTSRITDHILHCAESAAKIQVNEMTKVVLDFKQLLGARWDQVYAVISALWTLSQENVHALIIGSQMKQEQRETNLIVSEAVPTLADAKVLLGRIVGDRIAAQYVFSQKGSRAEREDIYSLSTQRDLLSQPAEKVLASEDFARLCPHLSRAKTAPADERP